MNKLTDYTRKQNYKKRPSMDHISLNLTFMKLSVMKFNLMHVAL